MHKYLAQALQIPWIDPDTHNTSSTEVDGPLLGSRLSSLGSILSRAMQYVFIFAGIGLFLMLVLGGFTFLTSAGDSKKLESGKQRLTYAIVGFVIIFVAYWLVQIFGFIFGLKEVTNIFPLN